MCMSMQVLLCVLDALSALRALYSSECYESCKVSAMKIVLGRGGADKFVLQQPVSGEMTRDLIELPST